MGLACASRRVACLVVAAGIVLKQRRSGDKIFALAVFEYHSDKRDIETTWNRHRFGHFDGASALKLASFFTVCLFTRCNEIRAEISANPPLVCLRQERVYHLSTELSKNASLSLYAARDSLDANEISNEVSPSIPLVLDSTESAIRRTSKARRSKKGSRK